MRCTTTEPGHETNLTGVKRALALRHDPYRAPVAARLAELLDAGAASAALFTAHEHQLLVEVDSESSTSGTTYVGPAGSTGAYVAFNLALPWHADGMRDVGGGCDAPVRRGTAVAG